MQGLPIAAAFFKEHVEKITKKQLYAIYENVYFIIACYMQRPPLYICIAALSAKMCYLHIDITI